MENRTTIVQGLGSRMVTRDVGVRRPTSVLGSPPCPCGGAMRLDGQHDPSFHAETRRHPMSDQANITKPHGSADQTITKRDISSIPNMGTIVPNEDQ